MSEEKRSAATISSTEASDAYTEFEHLPERFRQLKSDLRNLLESKFALAKIEMKEDFDAYVQRIKLIGLGVAIAAFGLVFINLAIACFIAAKLFAPGDVVTTLAMPIVRQQHETASYILGLILTETVFLMSGGIIAYVGLSRIRQERCLNS